MNRFKRFRAVLNRSVNRFKRFRAFKSTLTFNRFKRFRVVFSERCSNDFNQLGRYQPQTMIRTNLKRFDKISNDNGNATYECLHCQHTTNTAEGMRSHVNRHHNPIDAVELGKEPGEAFESGTETNAAVDFPPRDSDAPTAGRAVEVPDIRGWKSGENIPVCPECGSDGGVAIFEGSSGRTYGNLCPNCGETWCKVAIPVCPECGSDGETGKYEHPNGRTFSRWCPECYEAWD